ncbi:MAG: hypothetical protein QMB43_07685, partial [Alistipes putredinis]
TSKQCNFEILFFSFFPKILANRNVSHIFLSLSFEYDRSFAGKSPASHARRKILAKATQHLSFSNRPNIRSVATPPLH